MTLERAAPAPTRPIPRHVLLCGTGSESLSEALAQVGLRLVDNSNEADLVVVYGGDGSLLGADRDFPDLPKLIIRRNGEFTKCPRHLDEVVLRRVVEGRHTITRLPRLEAVIGNQRLQGINDVVFHNLKVTSGVRYRVRIDDEIYGDEIVGDGVVVATPFGSSAYYRSITKSVFRVGLGLAFNNSTEAVNHLVLREESRVEIHVTRGPAVVVADNTLEPVPVDAGDVIAIQITPSAAEIWELSTLTCRDCVHTETKIPAGFRHV